MCYIETYKIEKCQRPFGISSRSLKGLEEATKSTHSLVPPFSSKKTFYTCALGTEYSSKAYQWICLTSVCFLCIDLKINGILPKKEKSKMKSHL
jgi:hypothetical protein